MNVDLGMSSILVVTEERLDSEYKSVEPSDMIELRVAVVCAAAYVKCRHGET